MLARPTGSQDCKRSPDLFGAKRKKDILPGNHGLPLMAQNVAGEFGKQGIDPAIPAAGEQQIDRAAERVTMVPNGFERGCNRWSMGRNR